MNNDPRIPLYLITGFLDSGKTTLLIDTLEMDYFNDGQRTVLLMCEDGEVEASVFDRYRTPPVQGGQLQALYHRRHDPAGQGKGPRRVPEGPGGAGHPSQVPLISVR